MEEQNRLTDRIERKVSLARERDTRVIITRTSDTHRILDIVRSADKAIRDPEKRAPDPLHDPGGSSASGRLPEGGRGAEPKRRPNLR